MRYFRLLQDVNIPDRWHLGDLFDEKTNTALNLRSGQSFPRGITPRVEVTDEGIPLDFCTTSFNVPIARKRLGDVISRYAGQHLERISVKIIGHDGFEVLNITRAVKCLDETRTDFTKWSEGDGRPDRLGEYKMILNLKILSSGLPRNADIFRIEGWTIGLIVSDRLKSAMENCGCFGAEFIDVT